MSESLLRWRDHFAKNPLLLSANSDSFSVNGITVAATSNPDVLAFSVTTELPPWLDNLQTSNQLASDLQREHPGIKVLYEDDPVKYGLYIKLLHECYLTGMEDIDVVFNAIRQALRSALIAFTEKYTEL